MSVSLSPQFPMQRAPRVQRVPRRPSHTWQLRTPPFCVQPFCLVPVLAGETLKKMQMQSRVISDPVKSQLLGWWKEYYLYYVKVRDLREISYYKENVDRSLFEDMFINPDVDTANLRNVGLDPPWYKSTQSSVPWAKLCTQLVLEKYFRDNDESYTTADGVLTDTGGTGFVWYLSQVKNRGWHDSMVLKAEYDVPSDPGIVVGADDTVTMSEVDMMYRKWAHERAFGMTQLTYEAYLADQGVSVPGKQQQEGIPEELRFWIKYSYPANTVREASVASVLSWSFEESLEKDFIFLEPGFLLGLTVARPKVYFSGQTSAVANFMWQAIDWLPAQFRHDAYSSMKEFAASSGPVPGITGQSYWIDLRDLLTYGDQFTNFTLTATDAGLVALPSATAQKKYPALADISGLFSTATSRYIREDGVAQFSLLGRVEDRTVRT